MILIISIILIALSLSVDAFVLALSSGASKENYNKYLICGALVGIFHFFMPLIGSFFGTKLFEYTYISPKIIMFIVFFLLSLDMFINYFNSNQKIRELNIIGMIVFSFAVSIDSLSVGIGLKYIYDSILLCAFTFCIVSFLITLFGFLIGNEVSKKTGKYSFLVSSLVLFLYSLWVLTK